MHACSLHTHFLWEMQAAFSFVLSSLFLSLSISLPLCVHKQPTQQASLLTLLCEITEKRADAIPLTSAPIARKSVSPSRGRREKDREIRKLDRSVRQ